MRHRLALIPAALASASVLTAWASGPSTSTTTPLHCDGSRPAVAYYAGSRAVVDRSGTPAPCGGTTQYGSAESHISAEPDGSIVFTPAVVPSGFLGSDTPPVGVAATTQSNVSPAALAITRDRGAHWSLVRPSGVTWNPTDHAIFVDRATGRLFFEDYGTIPPKANFGASPEGPSYINWSADSGRSWHHFVISTVFLPENPRFTAGVAPPGQPKPHGYPHVLYYCADTNVGFTSPAITGRLCFRSLDGGASWQQRSVLFSDASTYAECGTNAEQFSSNDGKYPYAAPDGFLYVMVSCGGHAYLARSTDEAKTFRIMHVGGKALTVPANTPAAEMRIADDGTMYIVTGPVNGAATPRTVTLFASADRGHTWSRGINVTPPGIAHVQQWAMDVAGTDDVVVNYLAQRSGQATWDGYVTETRDARAALTGGPGPLFWSAQVNPVDRPLLYGNDIEGAGKIKTPAGFKDFPSLLRTSQGLGDEFIGAAIAYDGTPWGSFTEDCGPTPQAAGCVADHDQTRGYAGYLKWPAPTRPGAHASDSKPTLAATGPRVVVALTAALLVGAALVLTARRRTRA